MRRLRLGTLIVHFGLHLDGMRPDPPETALGVTHAGPARLLDLLETELGLPPVAPRPGEALLAYQACLVECTAPGRFYHESLQVDPLGVARTLAGWRAQWYEAGWQGRFSGAVSRRLSDQAEVERLAATRVPPTPGQRVQRVLAALDAGLRSQIERIVRHDELDALPSVWQALLARFRVDSATGITAQAHGVAGTDLHCVQRVLLELGATDLGAPRVRVPLAGDASLVVVRGVSRDLTAQAIGETLLSESERAGTVVIAERDGIIVDNALERVGLARAGFQHPSRFRAVTQVLKLAIGLVWEPVSPQLLLQFLIHPVGPLPDYARSQLADAVAAAPGIGGPTWQAALGKIEALLRERFGARDSEVAALRSEIAAWLEGLRYPAEAAPLEALIARTQRIASWLTRRLAQLEDLRDRTLFGTALAQADGLLAALADLGRHGTGTLSRIALERLVDEISGHSPDPGTYAEAGHVAATTEPALITRAWERVIWWDLKPPPLGAPPPWSDRMLAELRAQGVLLPDLAMRIARRSREWQRPILNARAQLILVTHERDEGEHPVWNLLASLFENFTETRIESALLEPGAGHSIPVLAVPTEPLAPRPLPAPRRWWRLPADCALPARPVESYSSLDKLVYSPHAWVLHYAARIRRGRAADLPTGSLLYGRLAHRLLECFFAAHADWATLDAAALDTWTARTLPELVTQEAAQLGAPGAGIEREQVLATLERALMRLLEQLRAADIDTVQAEHWSQAPFDGLMLQGGIDLLLKDRAGRESVLDVKWSGEDYRGRQLEEARPLQLATYAYLRRHATGQWPAYAYFIVTTGNIIAPDAHVFAGARVYASPEALGMDALWQRLTATVAWRRAQLARGAIEVNAPGTEPDADSAAPEGAWPTVAAPDRFDDYAWLTGWEPGA